MVCVSVLSLYRSKFYWFYSKYLSVGVAACHLFAVFYVCVCECVQTNYFVTSTSMIHHCTVHVRTNNNIRQESKSQKIEFTHCWILKNSFLCFNSVKLKIETNKRRKKIQAIVSRISSKFLSKHIILLWTSFFHCVKRRHIWNIEAQHWNVSKIVNKWTQKKEKYPKKSFLMYVCP